MTRTVLVGLLAAHRTHHHRAMNAYAAMPFGAYGYGYHRRDCAPGPRVLRADRYSQRSTEKALQAARWRAAGGMRWQTKDLRDVAKTMELFTDPSLFFWGRPTGGLPCSRHSLWALSLSA